MEINLPEGQRRTVEVIKKLRAKGRNPTLRELADASGVRSLNAVQQLLARLEKKGIVKPRPRRAPRAIELTEAYAA